MSKPDWIPSDALARVAERIQPALAGYNLTHEQMVAIREEAARAVIVDLGGAWRSYNDTYRRHTEYQFSFAYQGQWLDESKAAATKPDKH